MNDGEGIPLDSRDFVPVHERILVSEAVAAQLCSVSQPTFRKWIAAGAIRPVDLPGDVRRNLYRRADIEAFAGAATGTRARPIGCHAGSEIDEG